MARLTPYLHRRGHALIFRISVPAALRPMIGVRELVKALHTQDHRTAAPIALLLASQAKQLFIKMTKRKTSPGDELTGFDYSLEFNFNDVGEVSGLKITTDPHDKQEDVDSAIRTLIESNAATRQKYHTIAVCEPAGTGLPSIAASGTAGLPIVMFGAGAAICGNACGEIV